MKNIIKSILNDYKMSLIGYGIMCIALGVLFGLFHFMIERDATLITSIFGGLFYTPLVISMLSIVMIGITVMIAGDDHDLVKLIKKTKDTHQ